MLASLDGRDRRYGMLYRLDDAIGGMLRVRLAGVEPSGSDQAV
jgi:hypothetical protein